MFKKYGKLIFLVVLLLIATEITIYVNRQVDDKLVVDEETNTVGVIRKQLENSTAVADGMNPYRDYWVFELEHFRENYPAEEEELFKSVDIEQWDKDFEALVTLVSSEYIKDKTLMETVSDTIKKYIGSNYIFDIFTDDMDSGYFRNIILLMKDDQILE
jgi:hypothetical protein